MRRRGILKFVLALLVIHLALEVAGLDDNLAIESKMDKAEVGRSAEGFDWSFITGQPRNIGELDNFKWSSFNLESSAEEDEEDEEAVDRRMDDIDWGFQTPSSGEEDEAEKRLDDGIDWSFLTEHIDEEQDEVEHRMDEIDWSWAALGGSSVDEEEDDEIDERLEDVGELTEERDEPEYSQENLPSKWHQKLKKTKFSYGPPKIQKPPKGQYGPAKTPKRPKSQYGPPKGTKRPKYGAPKAPKAPKRTKTKYGAPKKTHKPTKGHYGPPKTTYHAPAYAQPQEPSYNHHQEPSYQQPSYSQPQVPSYNHHQAPASHPPQPEYKEADPVTYPPQPATNSVPPTYRQPELPSSSISPPPSINYQTTPDYSQSFFESSSSQSTPVVPYSPAIPTQDHYSTPSDPSYDSETHSPPAQRENAAPFFLPETEPPRQRLRQPTYEQVSDKNYNPGFFQHMSFPNLDEIFKQIFNF
ncbi:extensin-like [Daphnia pulicaria]|uniref:extensin-like n=1 Tax=Daphnia pulicaria TaxID=35523 RepID=UPI001EEB86D3|nr:extensin-like [Daphnia pulicaria]